MPRCVAGEDWSDDYATCQLYNGWYSKIWYYVRATTLWSNLLWPLDYEIMGKIVTRVGDAFFHNIRSSGS